jgi:predicted amidohydrolase YtcJ
MIEPYNDQPESTGSLLVDGSTLKDLTHTWSQAGFQVNIHAIGDLANRLVIDAFEAAYLHLCPNQTASECQKTHRFRIEHAQIIHPDDQKRMFHLGIIPSIQPTHATSDMAYAEARLGPLRTSKSAYRMRSFLPLSPILGSDFPVEPSEPLHGMYAAISRRSPHTRKGKDGVDQGWHEDESLTLDQALIGFTRAPAWGAFLEGRAGCIVEGAFADWVVLDEPLESVGIDGLLDVEIRETWVGGKRVYQRK